MFSYRICKNQVKYFLECFLQFGKSINSVNVQKLTGRFKLFNPVANHLFRRSSKIRDITILRWRKIMLNKLPGPKLKWKKNYR